MMNYHHALVAFILAATSTKAADQVSCYPCIDRTKVKIGVVTHGTPDDVYWQQMNDALRQGAHDMGITLRFNPLENEGLGKQPEIAAKMVEQIEGKKC